MIRAAGVSGLERPSALAWSILACKRDPSSDDHRRTSLLVNYRESIFLKAVEGLVVHDGQHGHHGRLIAGKNDKIRSGRFKAFGPPGMAESGALGWTGTKPYKQDSLGSGTFRRRGSAAVHGTPRRFPAVRI